jgi:8-oxo-dGTP pyrophosphatase MutT (NUDIX family)
MVLLDRATYLAGLPKKRMGAAVIFQNQEGKALIVNPTYKDHWLFVGGTVDEGESPRTACIREVKEETGIILEKVRLICVEYRNIPEGESVQFVFDGGILTEQQIANINLQQEELSEFKFVDIDEARILLGKYLVERLIYSLEAIKNNSTIYLENGKAI